MANVVAFDDVRETRFHRVVEGGKSAWRTNYMVPEHTGRSQPQAFLAECGPQRVLRTHFHEQDQFQIFVSGEGVAGKHAIKPFQVHFARAYTPYGPIVAAEEGVGFLTLRTRKDPGARFLPENREELLSTEGRKPWQLTTAVHFPKAGEPISIAALEGLYDERGLAGYAITMKPHAEGLAPDPSKTNGQYIVVLGGGLLHNGKLKKATTIVFLEPNESAFRLVAGPEGLEAVVLHFPVPEPGIVPAAEPAEENDEGEYKVWQCVLCGFVYDEAAGMPEDDIAPGTRWKDVPETWGCPDCSAMKGDFEMVEM